MTQCTLRWRGPLGSARRLGVWPTWATGAAVASGALLAPFVVTSDRWMRVLILVVVYIVLASGLNMLVGYAGLLDLGYVAFFTVGAYFTSIITVKVVVTHWGLTADQVWWLFFVNLLLGACVAAVFGMVLGYPTLRARGDYLAIMTLAFGEVVRQVAINWEGLTSGPAGIRGVPVPQIGSLVLITPTQLYYVAVLIAAFAIFTIGRIVRSYVGRAWIALREDHIVAESVGINTHRYKLLAYTLGAFYAGLIGVFFAHLQQFVNPDSFELEDNFLILSLVILGGAGTIWGPIVGAGLWILLQEWAGDLPAVQAHPELRFLALGAVVVLILRFLPQGIVRGRTDRRRREEASPAGTSGAEPAAGQHGSARPGPGTRDPVVALPREMPPEGGPALLRANGLTCRFGGVRALADVDIEVAAGEVLGIIGPNGAGKTTLFNALSGIQRCQEGQLAVAGESVTGRPAHEISARGLARTFQNIRLIGDLTVVENVLVAGHRELRVGPIGVVMRTARARARERDGEAAARAALEYVGIAADADRPAKSLSYGSQRRVEIARALMTRPRILLLDEPAAGMNHTETRELADLISRIRDDGVAVVLIEHDMTLLLEISDRVVVLDHGEKIADGKPEDVKLDERVLEAYLGGIA